MAHISSGVPLFPSKAKTPSTLNYFVPADSFGPGLDAKRDEAMFVFLKMKLPMQYQVVLLNDESIVTSRSTSTKQILNRVYIGQLQELSDLEDGTLTKAVLCSRDFPFVDRIDATLFMWEDSQPPSKQRLLELQIDLHFEIFPDQRRLVSIQIPFSYLVL